MVISAYKKKHLLILCFFILPLLFLFQCAESSSVDAVGRSGSLARFVIYKDFLYMVQEYNIEIYEIIDKWNPERIGSVNVEERVETIFLYKTYLYLGTAQGMNVYDLYNPRDPRYIGQHQHVLSCDPVVVQDDIAYITIRSGSGCRTGDNQLQIIDVVKPEAPELLASYPMTNPWGLGVDGNLLFVMDGDQGLKVFDVTEPTNIKKLDQIKTLTGYDVIPYNKLLVVSADHGLYFFDYSRIPLKKLGQIKIYLIQW